VKTAQGIQGKLGIVIDFNENPGARLEINNVEQALPFSSLTDNQHISVPKPEGAMWE
jgi:hypothetical protein